MAASDQPIRKQRFECVDDDMAAVLRLKTPEDRLRIGFGMIDSALSMLRSLLTSQHPDWTPEQIQSEVARRISHGDV